MYYICLYTSCIALISQIRKSGDFVYGILKLVRYADLIRKRVLFKVNQHFSSELVECASQKSI